MIRNPLFLNERRTSRLEIAVLGRGRPRTSINRPGPARNMLPAVSTKAIFCRRQASAVDGVTNGVIMSGGRRDGELR